MDLRSLTRVHRTIVVAIVVTLVGGLLWFIGAPPILLIVIAVAGCTWISLRVHWMSRLRAAILVAFVGATVWVFVPLLPLLTERPGLYDDYVAPWSLIVRSEIAIVTIAAVAWVLAGLVKPKA
jgi:hypothetical protein